MKQENQNSLQNLIPNTLEVPASLIIKQLKLKITIIFLHKLLDSLVQGNQWPFVAGNFRLKQTMKHWGLKHQISYSLSLWSVVYIHNVLRVSFSCHMVIKYWKDSTFGLQFLTISWRTSNITIVLTESISYKTTSKSLSSINMLL